MGKFAGTPWGPLNTIKLNILHYMAKANGHALSAEALWRIHTHIDIHIDIDIDMHIHLHIHILMHVK